MYSQIDGYYDSSQKDVSGPEVADVSPARGGGCESSPEVADVSPAQRWLM